ncbi:MAG: (2Fe-2S)-binding protein [Candidatus Acidiferrales bacterium]
MNKNRESDAPSRRAVSKNPSDDANGNGNKSDEFSRRSFLTQLSAAGIAAAAAPLIHSPHAVASPVTVVEPVPEIQVPGAERFVLNINGRDYRVMLEPRVTLLDALRENLQLPGTKKGCDHGQCGACTVHVNGRRVNSCLSFAIMHQGDKITTIEGLAQDGELSPMQAAFLEHDGFQCGYCTSGQIMSATALLKEPCGADDASVRECMSGNICRCGAYDNIVAAVQTVRKNG